MSVRSRRPGGAYWQSFADLGLALMAVMLLIAVVLIRQKDKAAEEQEKLAQEQKEEADELRQFAVELLDSLERAQDIVVRQEGVVAWVNSVFEDTSCELTLDPKTGQLGLRSNPGAPAELYASGEVVLSRDGQERLASCRLAFQRLSACMSGNAELRSRRCPIDPAESAAAAAFRDDIEALVLQGNTDRTRYVKAHRVRGLRSGLKPVPKFFVENAELGAERARQALGHLLSLIQDDSDDGTDKQQSLQVFMSRARIESASFGQYQAGAEPNLDGCDPDEIECTSARNLSLKLRWRQASLRRPFTAVRDAFCDEWRKGKAHSQLARTFDADQERKAKKLCDRGALGETP